MSYDIKEAYKGLERKMSGVQQKHHTRIVDYKDDVIEWSKQQALFLKKGDWQDLDINNLVEEILDVGRSERRELKSKMSVLLIHLIKWAYQPAMRSDSWKLSIRNQREAINIAIKITPSLKVSLKDTLWFELAWKDALPKVVKETGMPMNLFPQKPIWNAKQVMTKDWLPPQATKN